MDRKKIGELRAEEPTDKITYPVTDTEKCIADLWKNNLADIPEAIGTDWNFYELGGDSVVLFTIITKIEEAYDIKLSVADMMNLDTVKDMADYVDSLK